MSDEGRALSWDDAIGKDFSEFVVLPEGTYKYQVTGVERGRFEGSAKMGACPKLTVKCRILDEEGDMVTLEKALFLHTKCEVFLSAFFTSIGQRKKGEEFVPMWNKIVGSGGFCQVGLRTWTGKDGSEKTSNEIKEFLPPADDFPAGNAPF
jgi:hypothetical protein